MNSMIILAITLASINLDDVRTKPAAVRADIVMPDLPYTPPAPEPKPEPKPDPEAIPVLTADVSYIISSTKELVILCSPPGLVEVEAETGPVKIRGPFIDDPESKKFKTFQGPFIYSISPVKDGRLELIVIPVGVAKEDEIIRRRIDSLTAPKPPPAGTVPNLTGKHEAEAMSAIKSAGLNVGAVLHEHDKTPAGLVFKQNPPSGSLVVPGSAVDIWVSKGEQPLEPSPFTAEGFRVLIVVESDPNAMRALPPAQINALYSAKAREYMNEKCVLGPDGRQREWRVADPDQDFSNESKVWQDAMKRPRKSLPWILIGDGKRGYEGEFPPNVDALMTLLRKYGG